MRTRFVRLAAATAALSLVLAACGGGADETTTTTAAEAPDTTQAPTTEAPDTTAAPETTTTEAAPDEPETSPIGLPIIDPFDVTPGDIGIAGSSTVFPLSTAVMTLWEDEGGPNYAIDSIGSGGGLERFCVEGASDIANASRAINEEEVAACQSIDRDPIEVRVGTDALTLVISQGNYFAQDLTIEEIGTAFSLTASDATWADVNPDFPAHPIALFTPGTDSGTFDYFNEVVFDEADPSPILASIAQIIGEDDNLTVQGVGGDGCTEGDTTTTCGIGYFGYAYYAENADVLQAVAVEGVAPSDDTVNDGSYLIGRPLFMYTAASVIAEKPQVGEFMAYYLNNVNDLIGDVGYFPAPTEVLTEAADKLIAAAGW